MICESCGHKEAEAGRRECFRCRVASVGFAFVGGGGYGREAFSSRTTTEFLNETVGFDHGERIRRDEVAHVKEFGR